MAENGLEAVFLSNRDKLLQFLRSLARGDDAEDLLQELWLRAVTAETGPIAKPLSYLYRTAHNLALERYRQAARAQRRDQDWSESVSETVAGVSDEPSAERILVARERLRLAEEALHALGERAATVFRRYGIEGRSQHHLAVADLQFDGVRVGDDRLLADEAVAWLEPRLIAATGALQLGVSVGQLRRTVEYVSQRKQFGRVIGTFQLVAGQLADAQIAVEALRSALAQLVYRLDAGLGALPQALAVKVLAERAAHLVGHKAQHVHGGMGVDITYPIHRYLYWSRWLAATLGGAAPTLERLGDWLADHDQLGWKYDLPEDTGNLQGASHALG